MDSPCRHHQRSLPERVRCPDYHDVAIKIYEIESDNGTPGDWVELFTPRAVAVDLSGFTLRDNDNTLGYAVPVGTTIAPDGYLVMEEATLGFALDAADSARLFDRSGGLIDSHAWTAHATATFGRCSNGSDPFVTTLPPPKVPSKPARRCRRHSGWPSGPFQRQSEWLGLRNFRLYQCSFGGARNGPGSLFRLVPSGETWATGKTHQRYHLRRNKRTFGHGET